MPSSCGVSWRTVFVLVALLSGSLAGKFNGYIVNIAYPSWMWTYQISFDLVVWISIATPLGVAACLPNCGGTPRFRKPHTSGGYSTLP